MSLKVPKANNMQLFKEGYKMSSGTSRQLYGDRIAKTRTKASKMPCSGIYKLSPSCPTSSGQVSVPTVRRRITSDLMHSAVLKPGLQDGTSS